MYQNIGEGWHVKLSFISKTSNCQFWKILLIILIMFPDSCSDDMFFCLPSISIFFFPSHVSKIKQKMVNYLITLRGILFAASEVDKTFVCNVLLK